MEIYLSRDRYLFSFFSPNYRINCDIYIEQIYLYIHRKYRYMYRTWPVIIYHLEIHVCI